MQITGFEILKKTGNIGSVQLFEAKQLSLNRVVTLKVLEPKFASNPGEVKDFVHQARSVAHFKHPNVVEVYQIGEENNLFYIAEEHVSGKTLRQIVQEHGPMPFRRAVKVTQQAAEALQAAKDKANLIHKAISPDTILISDEGWIKITGFGQTIPSDARTLDAFINAGLLPDAITRYMSPEQAREEASIDQRSDIYSTGCVLYYILTGIEPFHEHKHIAALKRHISDKITHPREIVRTVPASMGLVIAKMLMKNTYDRYPDWKTVIADINKSGIGKIVTIQPGWEELSTIAPISAPQAFKKATQAFRNPKNILPVPSWIRIPVWVVLIMWWIVIAACLFREEIRARFGVDLVEEISR